MIWLIVTAIMISLAALGTYLCSYFDKYDKFYENKKNKIKQELVAEQKYLKSLEIICNRVEKRGN